MRTKTKIAMMDILNAKQKEAVTTADGPVLVIAGPGSGKTRCLTYRAAYLSQKGVPLDNILAVTFTNKAANEMKERIDRLLSGACPAKLRFAGRSGGTFHAICLQILRQNIGAPYKRNFVIYDESDRFSLIKKIIKESELSTERFKPGVVQATLSRAKDELADVGAYQQKADDYYTRQAGKIYERYQSCLEEANALDFDDLIMLTVKLLRSQPEILKKYQEKWPYIMVDEAHDINTSQYALMNLLAEKHRNLWLIADTDQSIYTWRGADFRHILNFEKDYPEAKTIFLEQNYRSTKNILQAGNDVISKNTNRKDKVLWTDNPEGDLINVIQADTAEEEGLFIIEEIENLVRERGYSLNDFTVLYRMNAQSRSIEEAFLKSNLPYKIIGTVRFYNRAEVKDILAYLRIVNNIHDSVSLQRVINTPPRRLARYSKNPELFFSSRGDAALKDFCRLIKGFEQKSKKLNLNDLIKHIIQKTDYENYLQKRAVTEEEAERRWENLQELCSISETYRGTDLEKFLEEAALFSSGDEVETKKDLVNLMTIHCAKGLEFPVVFLTGCEEGIFPHSKSLYLPEQMEEERRLCYVALTRAKHKIYLSCARQRRFWGQTTANAPSRFISDIPEHLINFQEYL